MRIVAIVVVIAACGGPSKPAQEPEPKTGYDEKELVQIAAGFHDVLTGMLAIVETRAGDCPAIARDFRALFAKSQPIFARAHRLAQDPDAARALTAELHTHDAEAAGIADKIADGLRPCAGDADVKAAIDAMPTLD